MSEPLALVGGPRRIPWEAGILACNLTMDNGLLLERKMPLVLVYDIPDDKRRDRLRKTLLGFGTPVQYSVFECDLTPRQVQRMRKAVLEVIELPEDNVRYYQLCRGCLVNVEVFGGQPVTRRNPVYVV